LRDQATQFAGAIEQGLAECDNEISCRVSRVRYHILSNAPQYFPELRDKFTVETSFPYRSSSLIARFCIDDGTCRKGIVAKWAPVYRENNEGLTEFTNYRIFNSVYRSELEFQCPTALAFLSEDNVLLTLEEPGLTLREILCRWFDNGISRSDLNSTLRAVGKWLRAYHQLSRPVEAGMDTGTENGLRYLHRCWATDADVSELLGSHGLALEQARKIADDPTILGELMVGRLHNDLWPGNIVVGKGKVTVLDAACNRAGVQFADIACFSTCVSLMGVTHFRSNDSRRLLAESFIAGYFGEAAVPSHLKRGLALLRLNAIAGNLERHCRRLAELPYPYRAAARSFLRRVYGSLINAAIRDLSGSWEAVPKGESD